MLPSEVLKAVVVCSQFQEVLIMLGVSKRSRAEMLRIIQGSKVEADVCFSSLAQSIKLESSLFCGQQCCSGVPLSALFIVPEDIEVMVLKRLPVELLCLLPGPPILDVQVRDMSGSFATVQRFGNSLAQWPLRRLRITGLEEEEVYDFCSVLQALHALEQLSVHNFCREDPLAERFAPILRALPQICTHLHVRHVLPLVRAFECLPPTVQVLGEVVLMAEVFYNSHVVGMSLSKFAKKFPVLPGVREVHALLGPGHYEQPTWPPSAEGASEAADILLQKFPALSRFMVAARVESVSSPPLLGLATHLHERGVQVEVTTLLPASRSSYAAATVDRVLQKLRASGVVAFRAPRGASWEFKCTLD